MTRERAVPILPGDDLALAKDFYVDKLGFKVLFEATEDGTNGIMGLERGTIELTIDCPMSGHGRNACASLRVNSADAYYGGILGNLSGCSPIAARPRGCRG